MSEQDKARKMAEEKAKEVIANWHATPLECKPGQSSTAEGFMELLAKDEAQLLEVITKALLQFARERESELREEAGVVKTPHLAEHELIELRAKFATLLQERDDWMERALRE